MLDGWNVSIRIKSGMDTSLNAYNSNRDQGSLYWMVLLRRYKYIHNTGQLKRQFSAPESMSDSVIPQFICMDQTEKYRNASPKLVSHFGGGETRKVAFAILRIAVALSIPDCNMLDAHRIIEI